jgi:CRP-like cAMP-binding protein
MVALEKIKKIQAFSGFSEDQLKAIQPFCQQIDYQRDDKLFTEGDEATHVWFIVDGQVDLRFEIPDRLTSAETTIDTVSVKDEGAKTLGWSCFVPPHRMRLSAYCVSRHSRIVRVARSDIEQAFAADPQMGFRFMSHLVKVVGYRFQQFQDEVAKHRGDYIMTGW